MEKACFEPIEITGVDKKLSVRRAETKDDLLQIPRIEREYFFESKKGDTGHVYSDEEVLELNPHGEFFLLESEDGLVGYTSVIFGEHGNPKIGTVSGDAYYAGSLLMPEFRRQGLSEPLNQLRELRAILYGCSRSITCLVANNRGSIAALSKAGFVLTKTVKGVFSPNEMVNGDRLVMVKKRSGRMPNSAENETIQISLDNAIETFAAVDQILNDQRVIVGQCLSEDHRNLVLELLA